MEKFYIDKLNRDEQIELAKNILSEKLIPLVSNEDTKELLIEKINNLSVVYLERQEFLDLQDLKEGDYNVPLACYGRGTVFMQNTRGINSKEFHGLIHEIIHSLSDHFKYDGKLGLLEGYFDENDVCQNRYKVINEAATEYITSSVLGEPFYCYSQDLKYTLELILQLAHISYEELLNIYFGKERWVTKELASRFNGDDITLLPKLLEEYDTRISSDINEEYNFSHVSEILLRTVNYKLDNHEHFDHEYVGGLLNKLLKDCYWVDMDVKTIEYYNDTIDRLLYYIKNR